ncbi:MAG: pyruvate dehydrogenase (acetyl-transferring) E1 component subunit alpha [Thermodesulfobacteriota bacterium]
MRGTFDPAILEGVEMLRILKPDGRMEEELRPEDLTDERIQALYREMVFLRLADQRALNLQRQGRMGTYAPFMGQEAAQVGSAAALGKEDWMFPSFRETAAMYMRGVPLAMIFAYWMGNQAGQRFPEGVRVMPISIPVGTHPLHAVGFAWASKIRGEPLCTIAYVGDGASSKGDFHEAMNMAGVFKTPTIFFCQNNHYAISVPRSLQTASRTIAQKALAYGFPGIQVDGNDLVAVYAATQQARRRALAGEGPTLIEAVTYRMGPHTTADDPTRYRTQEEVEAWKPMDPLLRVRKHLERCCLWDQEMDEAVRAFAEEKLNRVVEEAEGFPEPQPQDIFSYTLEEMPVALEKQMRDYLDFLNEQEA